jgi:aryl sulfotransferase
MFVHYGDLLGATETEMRRIAEFCEIDVPEEWWPRILEAVTIDAMRKEARGSAGDQDASAMIFEGGIERFLFKGTNGRWRGVLTDDDLLLYEKAVASLDPGLRGWLEGGRHASSPT